ncbi:hypothetical protein FDP41_007640 [Naegleria fowleri]|uniref:Uncharacterized protein n=1 Tax=Naegleria fowleri TaxID=5763 RepID=A0A6A5CEM7_NAEFO|nr:uncharacterized protein FDP41_007640 [Naegleria fowleri]KAF0983725.1 hypothetical protein FDP41_007640 [Naegleria fowleri]
MSKEESDHHMEKSLNNDAKTTNITSSSSMMVVDDSLETLPIRSARKIVQYINEQLEKNSEIPLPKKKAIQSVITEERVLKELEHILGKEYIKLSNDVIHLGNQLGINRKMDLEYSDRPEPIVLTTRVKSIYGGENLNRERSMNKPKTKRFDQSKYEHSYKLSRQQELNKLLMQNSKIERIDKHDIEENEPIRLIYEEEKPSEKEIEAYRGDKNEELTDEERALQQAVSYMNKFKDYFKYIHNIKFLKFIPSKAARAMIIENFEKYLMDAKYYIHFYHKYSYFWAPESTRSVEPYRGLYVPLDKRKEEDTYHFNTPVSKYEPLRTMIYQDFHDRVRNGLPPSLDLDAKLPSLAMHYARTTFVPPMTLDEMERLFYPLNDASAIRKQQHEIPKFEPKRPTSRVGFLNRFQHKYFTRKHLLQRHTYSNNASLKNKNIFVSYDSYSEMLSNVNGEDFLDKLSRLILVLGKSFKPFPDYFHAVGIFHTYSNSSNISMELIMLLCACLYMGVPFISPFTKVKNIENTLDDISNYCEIPLVMSSDHRIVSQMMGMTHSKVKHVLYYGHDESSTEEIIHRGELVTQDPISHILQPTKIHDHRITSSNQLPTTSWEYVPKSVDTSLQLHHFKSLLAGTVGIHSSQLEQAREDALNRFRQWQANTHSNENILFMTASNHMNGREEKLCMTNTIFEKILDSLSATMHEMISKVLMDSKEMFKYQRVQVLIISNGFSYMTPLLMAFCFEHSLSFSFVPNNVDESKLVKILNELKPNIIVTDTHTTNVVISRLLLASTDHHHNHINGQEHHNPLLESTHLSELMSSVEYRGLITDWTTSNIFKNIKKSFSSSSYSNKENDFKHNLLGLISIGEVICEEAARTILSYLPFCYQIVNSDSLIAPLVVRDLRLVYGQEQNYSFQILSPWKFVNMNGEARIIVKGPIVPKVDPLSSVENRKEEFILQDLQDIVFDTSKMTNPEAKGELIEKFAKTTMPDDIRQSLTKCLHLKEEFDFYNQVLSFVEKRERTEHVINLAFFDNCLYSALLDELETLAPLRDIHQAELEEVVKFLQLRIELTAQCVQFQLLDFRFRFSQALKNNQITFHFKEKPLPILYTNKYRKIDSDLKWVHNAFAKRVYIFQENGFIVNLDLLESLFEYYLWPSVTRCFMMAIAESNLLSMIVFGKIRQQIDRKLFQQITNNVQMQYEKCLFLGEVEKKNSTKWYSSLFHLQRNTSQKEYVELLQTVVPSFDKLKE